MRSYQAQTESGVEGKEGHLFKSLQENIEMFESEEYPGVMETDVLTFTDPRTHMNGVRIICPEGSFDLDADIKVYNDHNEYNAVRHILGILEGGEEIGNQFPLNLNLQYLNGVSFNKGCYIG